MLYTPAHIDPNTDPSESHFGEGLGASSTRGHHQPLSPQTDCVRADSFHLRTGGLCGTGFPQTTLKGPALPLYREINSATTGVV